MKIRALIFAVLTSIFFFSACTDKKKTEQKSETEISVEVKQSSGEGTTTESEERRLDSIRQVKEHGHAH